MEPSDLACGHVVPWTDPRVEMYGGPAVPGPARVLWATHVSCQPCMYTASPGPSVSCMWRVGWTQYRGIA